VQSGLRADPLGIHRGPIAVDQVAIESIFDIRSTVLTAVELGKSQLVAMLFPVICAAGSDLTPPNVIATGMEFVAFAGHDIVIVVPEIFVIKGIVKAPIRRTHALGTKDAEIAMPT
jgi:hypothetical protein